MATTRGLSLVEYYLFFAMPILLAAAAYLLYLSNQWVLAALALVPVAFALLSLQLAPELPVGVTRSLGAQLSLLPKSFRISPVLALFCLVYCLFLKKWGHIK